MRDVTFPWELEKSLDEEEEEEGEQEKEKDLQGRPDDEVIFDI